MKYYFAPMEGLTDMVYRRTHHEFYPGVDRYYTPFVSPTQHHVFTQRQLRELSAENNAGVPVVPQLLGKNADDFLWAVNALADMGYTEVNLNLGCPSSTVTAKGKGSGFLAHPVMLEQFLETIYTASPLPISIKSRLGMESPEEFDRILSIYNRFPVCELILHPRTKREMYNGAVHMDAFQRAQEIARMPVCYNGDLFTPDDVNRFSDAYPAIECVMIGRGLVADPAMTTKLLGGRNDKAMLRQFHLALCGQYVDVFESEANAMPRMKAIWAHMLGRFDGGEKHRKALIKTKRWGDFLAVTEDIFQTYDLL